MSTAPRRPRSALGHLLAQPERIHPPVNLLSVAAVEPRRRADAAPGCGRASRPAPRASGRRGSQFRASRPSAPSLSRSPTPPLAPPLARRTRSARRRRRACRARPARGPAGRRRAGCRATRAADDTPRRAPRTPSARPVPPAMARRASGRAAAPSQRNKSPRRRRNGGIANLPQRQAPRSRSRRKPPCCHLRGQVAVGRGDDSHVDGERAHRPLPQLHWI